jgi:HD-like signal output (HDOD) protein
MTFMAAKVKTEPNRFDESRSKREILLDQILNNPVLPTPQSLALQIVRAVSNPDCEVEHVVKLISQDPAICAKILKTLNSCMYGLSSPVTSIRRAVTFAGLHPLRSMVLGLTLPTLHSHIKADQSLRDFWKTSVIGAIIAWELAKRFNYPIPEDVLSASLMRDLGVPLLYQAFGDVYNPVWKNQQTVWGRRQCAWEEEFLGINHADTGAALLRRWGLPGEIAESVRLHHEAPKFENANDVLARRICLIEFSSRLAHLDEAFDCPDFLEGILESAEEQFSLSARELERFLEELHTPIKEFADILQVDLGTCPNFAEILAAGYEELVRLSVSPVRSPHREELRCETGVDKPKVNAGRANDFDTPSTSIDIGWTSPENYNLEFVKQLGKPENAVRIQEFEILDVIGQGGMGIVFKALDLKLRRNVALKMPNPTLASSRTACRRFAREARAAAAILHENVVTTFMVSEMCGVYFIVMECVNGSSLQELHNSGRRFSPAEVISIGWQCAKGLAAAHELGIIHRDIKPANILLDRSGKRVRITDFGLARAMDDSQQISHDESLTGTPSYMSPEQVLDRPQDHRTDLFSLGSLLYMLCTGRLPFTEQTIVATAFAITERPAPPIRSLNRAVPESLVKVIEKLHAKRPEDRYSSAVELAEALQPMLDISSSKSNH